MRARMALHIAETKYEHREVILRNKPADLLAASLKGSVPVFILNDGTVLDESLDIMRWALPDSHIESGITDDIDGPFKFHLDRYKYASRYDDTANRGDVDLEHRAKAVAVLKPLDLRLARTAYLSGNDLGPNDMASFPFIRQFAAVEPEWWAGTDDIIHLQNWLLNCVRSDLFKAIMIKYPIWVPAH